MRYTTFSLRVLAAAAFIVLTFNLSACSKGEENAAAPAAPAATAPATQADTSPAASSSDSSTIQWMGYTEGLQKAKETGKPVFVDFYTTWCKYCVKLDETTYKDPQVIKTLNNDFIPVKVDCESDEIITTATGESMSQRSLANVNKINGFPTLAVLDSNGNNVTVQPGYMAAPDMQKFLASNMGKVNGGK